MIRVEFYHVGNPTERIHLWREATHVPRKMDTIIHPERGSHVWTVVQVEWESSGKTVVLYVTEGRNAYI